MSWRGQGGRRAKGRRGDQDPELDNTAWLAELEREAAAQADDDEDDWVSDCESGPVRVSMRFARGRVCHREIVVAFVRPLDVVPEEYRGIGVRIEDDVLVRERDNEVLTAALVKDADGIEKLMNA